MITSARAADDLLCNRHSNQSDVYSYHWNTNCRQSWQHVSPYISAIIPNASHFQFAIYPVRYKSAVYPTTLVLHNFHFTVTDMLLFSYVVVFILAVVVVVVVGVVAVVVVAGVVAVVVAVVVAIVVAVVVVAAVVAVLVAVGVALVVVVVEINE